MSRTLIIWVLTILIVLQVGCTSNDRYQHKTNAEAGVCLSFDDRTIDQWFELRELFKTYHAHVTFFVTRFDSLSTEQIEMLKILQADGHEIGFHGALHVISEHYIKEHSFNEYIEKEIVDGINIMNEAGFYPTSFSYPYSAKYRGTDEELLKYFYVLRSEVVLGKEDHVASKNTMYFKQDGERLVYAAAIDRNGSFNEQRIEEAMKRAVENKEVLMLYGHEPGRTFDVDLLQSILKTADRLNLKTFRVSDLIK